MKSKQTIITVTRDFIQGLRDIWHKFLALSLCSNGTWENSVDRGSCFFKYTEVLIPALSKVK